MIVSFRPACRWLQFSLRTFLVAVTIGCAWLGWTVERARRRSQAIDAIVNEGGTVVYDYFGAYPLILSPSRAHENHFWLDVKRIPVVIILRWSVDATLGSNLARVNSIQVLSIWRAVDADLKFLEGVQGKVDIVLETNTVTDAALERLQKRLPDAEIKKQWRT